MKLGPSSSLNFKKAFVSYYNRWRSYQSFNRRTLNEEGLTYTTQINEGSQIVAKRLTEWYPRKFTEEIIEQFFKKFIRQILRRFIPQIVKNFLSRLIERFSNKPSAQFPLTLNKELVYWPVAQIISEGFSRSLLHRFLGTLSGNLLRRLSSGFSRSLPPRLSSRFLEAFSTDFWAV